MAHRSKYKPFFRYLLSFTCQTDSLINRKYIQVSLKILFEIFIFFMNIQRIAIDPLFPLPKSNNFKTFNTDNILENNKY